MCEDAPCCGCCGPVLGETDPREREELIYAAQGWPGDGSGLDDLADHNANEADDYRDEGNEDCHLDSFGEE